MSLMVIISISMTSTWLQIAINDIRDARLKGALSAASSSSSSLKLAGAQGSSWHRTGRREAVHVHAGVAHQWRAAGTGCPAG